MAEIILLSEWGGRMKAVPTQALGNTLHISHPALFFFFFSQIKQNTFCYAKHPLGGGENVCETFGSDMHR